jgi:hypothetical protein
MATFIQGVTDTNLDPVLFTPDYSFLRYTLDKKSAQYEQGLKSVSSAYGELKKELTDPTNVERRDNYLKAAQNQLQQIASSDLSLQQNVNAANAIFDPISTDAAIAYDGYHTSRIKRELAEMDNWAQSDDVNERKKYNKQIYDWVARDLDSLKNGNGNVSNYKVQGRSAWGYIDPQDIIMKAAKDRGLKLEVDTPGNPYIVSTVGGETFRSNYDSFAREVLKADPLYTKQRSILAQAKVENEVQERRYFNPTLTKEQALNSYVDDKYVIERDGQKEYIGSLNDRLAQQIAELQTYNIANAADINAGKPAAVIAQQKLAQINKFKEDISGLQSEFNENFGTDDKVFEEKKEAFKKKFVSNPEGYFADQALVEDAKRYSNIQSTFGSHTIKADQGYLGMMNVVNQMRRTLGTLQNNEFDNNMDALELQEKAREFDAKGAVKGGLASKRTNADGSVKAPELQYIGDSSTIITTSSKLNQLQNKIESTAALAINDLSNGLNILEYMGNKVEDVSQIRGYFQKKLADPSLVANKEQKEALQRVYKNVFEWAKQNNNEEMLSSMRDQVKAGKDVKDIDFAALLMMGVKNYQPTDNIGMNAMMSLADYHKKQELINTMKTGYDKAVNYVVDNVKNEKDFMPIIRKDKDGKPRLLDESDVEKLFNVKDVSGKDIVPANIKKEMTAAWFNGTLKIEKDTSANNTSSLTGSTGIYHEPGTWVTYKDKTYYFPKDIFGGLPTQETYKNLMKRLNEKISVPIMDESNEEKATASSLIELNGPLKDRMSSILSEATQINSNIYELNSGQMNDYKQMDVEDQGVIRSALKDSDVKKDFILVPSSPISEGSMMVKVTFAEKKSEKDTNPVAGKTVYFPIDPTKGTPDELQMLARGNDNSEFMQKSKKNEPYVIDYFEGSGVKAMIYPTAPGSNTASVRLMYKYDPTHQVYTDSWQQAGEAFEVDFSQNPFDEVRSEIMSKFITPYMQRRVEYNKTQVAKTNPDGSSSLSTQITNELNKLKG